MTGLEKSAKKDTVSMIATVVLYGVGASSIPYLWLSNLLGGAKEVEWLVAFAIKMLCSSLPIYLIIQFGFSNMLKINGAKVKGLIFALPAFLVVLNNLPFIPLMLGDMSINATFSKILTYCLFCLSIGFLEETVFRGCVLPLFMFKFKKDKKGLFWAVVLSSAVFGAVHLFNLLAGFSPMVFLQVGYSFLIGMVCAFSLLVTGSIFVPVLLHAIFDVGGFLIGEGLAVGVLWGLYNVLWTAISSVVFAIAIIIIFIKKDFSHLYNDWNLNRIEEARKES